MSCKAKTGARTSSKKASAAKRGAAASKSRASASRKKAAKKAARSGAVAKKTARKQAAVKNERKVVQKTKGKTRASAVAEVQKVIRQTFKRRAPSKPLSAKEKEALREALTQLRDRIIDEIQFLSSDNLSRSQRDATGDLSGYGLHMADQGTDNYDREFALNLISSDQDILYEIEEALQRLEAGTYGKCESCNEYIDKRRLEALPFARLCIRCQSEQERQASLNRVRGGGAVPPRRPLLD